MNNKTKVNIFLVFICNNAKFTINFMIAVKLLYLENFCDYQKILD